MRPILTEQERSSLDQRVGEAEQRTGAQIVLAYVPQSDVYPELPWKAFALGASLAGLVITAIDLLRPTWSLSHAVLMSVVAALAAGAALALVCVTVPRFARIFLDRVRAEAEVRQYAEALFLSRELFATAGRRGVLLLVSLFERQVLLLPDSGARDRLPLDAQQRIIARVTAALAEGRLAPALEEGLASLEEALGAGHGDPGGNELPDTVVAGEGA